MIIKDIEQNSEAWFEYRLGKLGGSGFGDTYISTLPLKTRMIEFLEGRGAAISNAEKRSFTASDFAEMLEPEELAQLKLEHAPKKGYYELVAERVARPLTPNDYKDQLNGVPFSMMARGHILEPAAKIAAESKLGVKFDGGKKVWEREDNPDSFVSPDGWGKDEDGRVTRALEIKCPSSAKVVEAFLTNSYPQEYFPQVCKYFIVNEDLEVLYFAIYTDLIPELEIQIWEIHRESIERSLAEMKAFEDAILKRATFDTQKITELGF